jgi:hypothetical protein
MFWRPSPRVAAEPSSSAMRCLATASIGMKITEPIASRMPARDSSAWSPSISARADS